MFCYAIIPSPIGGLTAVSEDGYLTALHLHPVKMPDSAIMNENDPVLTLTKRWLESYFNGAVPTVYIPTKPIGTPFQQSVWTILERIPYGKSVTYGQIAAEIDGSMSAQAVGQAVGRNPINIIIPCHRVLGTGCKLTGYSGGLDKKRFLLDLERIKYR